MNSPKTHGTAAPCTSDPTAMLEPTPPTFDGLFDELPAALSEVHQQALVEQICSLLKVHMQIEEETLYPESSMSHRDQHWTAEGRFEPPPQVGRTAALKAEVPNRHHVDAQVKMLLGSGSHPLDETRRQASCKPRAAPLDSNPAGAPMVAAQRDRL